jgi:aryl-alcohol dehydrogenase-like predicted oxidoreductase
MPMSQPPLSLDPSRATGSVPHTPLAGCATRGGTMRASRRDRLEGTPDDRFRSLHDGLLAGALAAGTALGDADDKADRRWRAGLARALASGVTLLDTAINYRCQRAERIVGEALRAAVSAGLVHRDEIVVCTKGGYVALDGELPPTREAYRAWVEREYLAPRLIARADLVAGGHCLAPRFLAHQLARSRANLGVQKVDLYYLHHPEQQREARGATAFRSVLREAVEMLETKVAAGEIAAWGVATWEGLRVPPDHPRHLPIAEVVAVAREVAGQSHHLRAVQVPINLAMPEAVRLPTQELASSSGIRIPALQACAELGLAVVASAPLLSGRLTSGLPPALVETFPNCETDAQRALAFVLALPGVSAVACGMSDPAHVEENLAVLGLGVSEAL